MASPRMMFLGAAFATFGLALGIGQASAATGLQTCLAECKRANLSQTNRASCRLDCEADAASDPEVIRARMAEPSRAAAPRVRPPASTTIAPRTPPPVAPARSQAAFLGKCHATCKPGRSEREAADYETCKLDCDTMASVLDVAVTLVPDAWMTSPTITSDIEPVAPPVVTPTPRPVARPTAPASTGLATCGPNLQSCRETCVKTETKCNGRCGRKHVSETDRETCKLGCGTDQEVCQGDCLTATATCVSSNSPPRGG